MEERARRRGVRAWVAAAAVSAAIVFGSPYIGQVRGAVQSALPGQYRTIVGVLVAIAAAAALVAGLTRIRERRVPRYACLIGAVAIAAAYARLVSTDNADQNLVELFHFVQYGLLAYLFYRACASRQDVTRFILPMCATSLVGIADEAFQWFVPSRVGELHDVLINAVAGACGLLFSAGVEPPGRLLPASRRSRLVAAGALAGTWLVTAGFVDLVHRGSIVPESTVGRFVSTFSRAQLEAAAADRAARWPAAPPVTPPGIAREDHYLTEGNWHLQRRNDAMRADDVWTAWNENLILEKYFAPLLDLGHRWEPAERERLSQRSVASANGYVSDAHPYPITTLRARHYWGSAAAVSLVILMLAARRTAPAVQEGLTGRR